MRRSRRISVWIAGHVEHVTDGAWLIVCKGTGQFLWVPRFAVGNIRHHAIDRGVHLWHIHRRFRDLHKFKALNPKEVQSLLHGDVPDQPVRKRA